jgi:SAM-dependent MidA family methyltransferase
MLAILLRNAAGLTLAAPVTVHFSSEERIGNAGNFTTAPHAANGTA